MKHAFRLSLIVLLFVCLCAASAVAQTPTPTPTPSGSPTPDPFFTQVTPSASTADSFAGGISGNGRFVVFESTGDLSSLRPGDVTRTVTNADGNREIFLFDYAQRRIFQITNTTSARKDTTKSDADRTKTPVDFSNTVVEVSNNRPVISRNGRWIVFSSNASTPGSFDGTAATDALKADGNQEIFLYQIPAVGAADLRSGADPGFTDLSAGTFVRVTDTTASRLPQAGTTTSAPFVADDNRMAQPNDFASRIVFVSTRNLTTVNQRTNADANPEVYVWNRPSAIGAAGTFSQITSTTGAFTFNENPTISGDSDGTTEVPTSTIAFSSNATSMVDSTNANAAANNPDGNAEVFVAVGFNGTTDAGITQATRTKRTNIGDIVNVFNPGRRISRDGSRLAFETVATDPKDESKGNQSVRGMYVYVISTATFIQVGPRASTTNVSDEDVLRFPVFTGDSRQLVFVSSLNFTERGGLLATGDAAGLNPNANRYKQIYSVPVPDSSSTELTFTRLSNTQSGQGFATLQPFVSDTTERLAFSLGFAELGGGNTEGSTEVFYLNVPPATGATNTPAADSNLAYFTGASLRQVVTPAASPTPTPSPTPAATPVTGLAQGMLGVVRTTEASGATVKFSTTTVGICPTNNAACDAASLQRHSPPLPTQLGGVSLSISNAAAGLYFVSPTEIRFVVPPGLAAQTGSNTNPVVININEGGVVRTIRSVLQITGAQPDIFTSTDGPGGRARVFNVTTGTFMAEPADGFPVTTDVNGTATPTVLAIMLTGLGRPVPAGTAVTVTIGTKTVTGATAVIPMLTDAPGFEQINVTLPADFAGLGDQPLIVSIVAGGVTYTSRPADTAPHIRIK